MHVRRLVKLASKQVSCLKINNNVDDGLTVFPAIQDSVVCRVVWLCTLVADIASNMDPDQTAPFMREQSDQGLYCLLL